MTGTEAIVLGALQGLTELFPVSSLGHTVIIPALFGWDIDQSAPFFVSFLVLTHFATALVLLGFYAREWLAILQGFFHSLVTRSLAHPYARLAWLIVLATIPAGLVGLAFQKKLEALFAAPAFAAAFLVGNGVVLLGAEYLARRRRASGEASDDRIAKLSFKAAVMIGVSECLALLPGFSRTGATLGGGLLAGLTHADAARFSFLLATPIIFAAALLKVPHLVIAGGAGLTVALLGALTAAVCAYLSVRFLTRYFRTQTLTPFALYCIIAGAVSLLLLA